MIETAVGDLASILIGQDPTHIERLWQRMYSAQMGHGVTGTVGAGAIAGLDMALWDIKGKVLNTPVWNLLGGMVRDRIRIYAHASDVDVARSLVRRGVSAIKTGGLAEPLRKVEALREAVGDDVDLMVDLHGPPWLTTKEAIALGGTRWSQVIYCSSKSRSLRKTLMDWSVSHGACTFRSLQGRGLAPYGAGARLLTAGLWTSYSQMQVGRG